MDLIYMNSDKEDIGVINDYSLDLAIGDENDFECTVDSKQHCCEAGYYIYIEGTEYGGIIDKIQVDTDAEEVKYIGRTWHGILNTKILSPDANQDYLTCNGDANSVLSTLISRMGVNALYSASNSSSGININNYKMDRYISGYEGIKKMLKNASAKLKMVFSDGYVVLSAVSIHDYSEDEQFDTDLVHFNIQRNFKPINHVICMGRGDLKERRIIQVYADAEGNISGTQTLTGMNEVCATYDYPNAESDDELIKGGIDLIKKSFASDNIDIDFTSNDESFDIEDIVGAVERITGILVKASISRKIVSIQNGFTNISYKCGKGTGSVAGSGYPSSGGGGSSTIALNDLTNVVITNPDGGQGLIYNESLDKWVNADLNLDKKFNYIGEISDLNNPTTSEYGVYAFGHYPTSASNKPTNGNDGLLLIMKYSPTYIYEWAFVGNQHSEVYKRTKWNDSWGSWEKVISSEGGTFTGKVNLNGGVALNANTPSRADMPFFLGIDAYDDGGTIKWIDKGSVADDINALKKSGGDITGSIARSASNSWIMARDMVALNKYKPNSGSYSPAIGQKTDSGHWTIGNLQGQESLSIAYTKDSDFNANPKINASNQVQLRHNVAGTIALTSEIPSSQSVSITQNSTTIGTTNTKLFTFTVPKSGWYLWQPSYRASIPTNGWASFHISTENPPQYAPYAYQDSIFMSEGYHCLGIGCSLKQLYGGTTYYIWGAASTSVTFEAWQRFLFLCN